jgi:hypothetical protein
MARKLWIISREYKPLPAKEKLVPEKRGYGKLGLSDGREH